MAEGVGFEPTLGGYPKHAFQACALSHSAIPPAHRRFTCCPWRAQEFQRFSSPPTRVRVRACETGVIRAEP